MALLLMLLAWHFVGDFLFQSNWMAINKSTSTKALSLHVTAYTAAFIPVILWMEHGVLFGVLTFLIHFCVDAVTSRLTSWLWFVRAEGGHNLYVKGGGPTCTLVFHDAKRHWFFVVIGFDQFLHACSLAWAAWYCGWAA